MIYWTPEQFKEELSLRSIAKNNNGQIVDLEILEEIMLDERLDPDMKLVLKYDIENYKKLVTQGKFEELFKNPEIIDFKINYNKNHE